MWQSWCLAVVVFGGWGNLCALEQRCAQSFFSTSRPKSMMPLQPPGISGEGAVPIIPVEDSQTYLQRGSAYAMQGAYEAAITCFLHGIACCNKTDDKKALESTLYRLLGKAVARSSGPSLARRYYEQALICAAQSRQAAEAIEAYRTLGLAYQCQGDFKRAEHHFSAAYRLITLVQCRLSSVLKLYSALGNFCWNCKGYKAEAETYYRLGERLLDYHADRCTLVSMQKHCRNARVACFYAAYGCFLASCGDLAQSITVLVKGCEQADPIRNKEYLLLWCTLGYQVLAAQAVEYAKIALSYLKKMAPCSFMYSLDMWHDCLHVKKALEAMVLRAAEEGDVFPTPRTPRNIPDPYAALFV